MLAARFAYLTALAVWVGGLVVLGLVAAPSLFAVLPAQDPLGGRTLAGALFGAMFQRFHLVAYTAGAIMLVALVAMAVLGPRPRGFKVRLLLVTIMVGISLYSGFVLTGRIERLRRDIGGSVERLAETDPRKREFGRLHGLSSTLMLLTVVVGAGLLFNEARDVAE